MIRKVSGRTLKLISYDAPDPGGLTGKRSNNYYICVIPPTFNGAASQLHFYSVVEE
jgi:hypothetical protein